MDYEGVLIWEETGKDADGFPQTIQRKVPAYLRETAVKRAEAYEAMRSGVKLSAVFQVRLEDWEETRHLNNEKPAYAEKAVIDGATYDIIRVYKPDKSMVELTCS